MASKIDRAEVLRVAALAHLTLPESPNDVERLAVDLSAILTYAQSVLEVDTRGVEATAHTHAGTTVWRDDVIEPARPRAEFLAGAPDADVTAGLFRVPRVVTRDA